MQEIKEKIIDELRKAGLNADISVLEIPPKKELGDFAFPCFAFAKELKKAPNEIAKEYADKIDKKDFKEVKPFGPYINFFLKNESVVSELKEIHQKADNFGKKENNKKIVLIESPSPNTNKTLHLGHVRNMVIGKALFNMLKANGYDSKLINLNNDRGIHICKSMLAYQKFGKDDSPEKSCLKSDHFVAKYYVLFSEKVKEFPELNKEAQEMLKKWEANDKEVISLWKKINNWALQGFNETYKLFNMDFDKEYFESEFYDKGKQIVIDGLKKDIFEKEKDGSIIINLEDIGLDKKVLLRSDNTTVYMTQDIYLAKKKFEDFNYDKSIYIVANEQNYHFDVLFEILKRLKFEFADKCYHFSYGMINLPSGRMKSREGTVVDADNLVKEVVELSKKEIIKRHSNIDESSLNERAKKIAMSAIIFHILKHDPKKDFVYNPEESLSFEGETGPYCQYVYARIQSIIRKSDSKPEFKPELLNELQEKDLIKKLLEYPQIIEKISENYKISLIPRYLLELCKEFNNYYSNHKVIQDNKELQSARLFLIQAVAQVIKNALSLLSIEVIDEM
jgi:arginyl-tRNA synthetase